MLILMSREARRRLVTFVADRVPITADMDDKEINVAVRAIQDEFKAVAGADPHLYHETCQAALRSVVRMLRHKAQQDDDDVPEYVIARRKHGYRPYSGD
jgi:hypothetical protein